MIVKIYWEDLDKGKRSMIIEDLQNEVEDELYNEMEDDKTYDIPQDLLGNSPAQLDDWLRKTKEVDPAEYKMQLVNQRLQNFEGALGEI